MLCFRHSQVPGSMLAAPDKRPHDFRSPVPASSDSAQCALPCPFHAVALFSAFQASYSLPQINGHCSGVDNELSSLSWSCSVHCHCCHAWHQDGSSQKFPMSHVPVTPHPAAGGVRSSDFPWRQQDRGVVDSKTPRPWTGDTKHAYRKD